MRVLISEDDPISCRVLHATLERSGHDVAVTSNGDEAWEILEGDDPPRLAILDWMMPCMDGIEVCQRIRARHDAGYIYVILLTARGQKSDRAAGFEAGADDYLTKPFDHHELLSRIAVGERILNLQGMLQDKVSDLETALAHVKQLQGLLPICMHCKKIRDDDASWHRLETYIQEHSDVMFTHSVCGGCLATHYPEFEEKVAAKERESR